MRITSLSILAGAVFLGFVCGFFLVSQLPAHGAHITPFQATTTLEFTAGQNRPSAAVTTVPDHKRLVIEFATYDGQDTHATFTHAHLVTTVAGTEVRHRLNVTPGGLVEITQSAQVIAFSGEQLMRVYADPGTTVQLQVTRFDSTGNGTGNGTITLSGYLQDIS